MIVSESPTGSLLASFLFLLIEVAECRLFKQHTVLPLPLHPHPSLQPQLSANQVEKLIFRDSTYIGLESRSSIRQYGLNSKVNDLCWQLKGGDLNETGVENQVWPAEQLYQVSVSASLIFLHFALDITGLSDVLLVVNLPMYVYILGIKHWPPQMLTSKTSVGLPEIGKPFSSSKAGSVSQLSQSVKQIHRRETDIARCLTI